MIDYTDPATANQRLSHAERDEAVAALEQFAAEGRLTDAEADQRSATAKTAVTRGDLAPLFADLPVAGTGERAAAAQAAPAQGAAPFAAGQEQYGAPQQQYPYSAGGDRSRNPWRYGVVSIMPFVALALFFITGNIAGFSYAWLWFLLIPIAGIVFYNMGGYSDRDRH